MSTTTRLIALADELDELSRLAGIKSTQLKAEGDNVGAWFYTGKQDAYANSWRRVLELIEVETIGEEVAS